MKGYNPFNSLTKSRDIFIDSKVMASIQSYIDYCSSSWYESLSASLKTKLDVLQRKMLRFVFRFDYRQHVGKAEFKSLSWLTISDRVNYFKLVHLFQIRHNRSPQYLRPNFKSVSDAHSYRTRGSSTSNYHVSKSLSSDTSSFAYSCVKLWNNLPPRIKSIDSLMVFKRELRTWLLSSYG